VLLWATPGTAQVPGVGVSSAQGPGDAPVTPALPRPVADSLAAPAADDSSDALSPADSSAAESDAEPTVGEISVAGNERTESTRILRSFEVPPGTRYSKDALRRGLRKLFALGLFQDVYLEEIQRPGNVTDLVIHVQERPRVGSITFTGNKKRETSELEKKIHLHVGDVLQPQSLGVEVDSLTRFYRDEGFGRVRVTAVADTNATANSVAVRFDVAEGEKVRITAIVVDGSKALPEKRVRKAMKTKPKGFFGGGEIKDETWAEDRQRIEGLYHDSGYRDARVSDITTRPGAKPRDLTLVVTVDEGPFYRFGAVRWEGETLVDSATVRRFPQPKPGDTYAASRMDRAREAAYGEYAERGYLYVDIEPREDAHDGVVDVTFGVREGRPSQVRLVNVIGNHATRERVIRREITLHEGDRFKKSALVRTQGDIFRLGIFEDVQVDFSPADSTDVDINLRVKEKQVGTASAGAGYTAQTGVTGFLELAHNNVLGNGQSLALHLERGGKVEDYSLSFTEPWFRGTPTLLGFSLFNTNTDRDYYSEKHRGGSVRVGRPLPWPDYSRGSLSYRLEDVTISGTLPTLTQTDYARSVLGRPVRTSSVEGVFTRNSTDNPFYPTKGTKLDLDHEFAGGLLGGGVDFHKHRIEGRAYLPSFAKHLTTMMRARVGLLGDYGDPSHLPDYERFRLGGGTTLDPLRGYDDYQVVPGKFITPTYDTTFAWVHNPSDFNDSTRVVSSVAPTGNKIRYPGGRFMTLYTFEQQFPIVHPLHGVLFADAGNTWDLWREIKPFDLKIGAGAGIRMEIPMLGNVGLDWGYGFNRDDGAHGKFHFLLGNVSF